MKVLALWEQHTFLGWGWIMYWVPWIPMFGTLVIRPDGTPTLSAHNAYIEALFQTGVVGAALIVVLVLTLTFRSFRLAVHYLDSDASVLLPALLMTAMVVQSMTESRLLSEGNWVTVCAWAPGSDCTRSSSASTMIPGRSRRACPEHAE